MPIEYSLMGSARRLIMGGALLVEDVVGALACERLTELKLTAGREGCGVRLCLAYWVAQVCNADAPDHRRVAKDDWRAGEAVEESNSGAKKNRRDVDVDFVEEPRIQALLDGVGAVDANGLPGGGGFGLVHGACDAVAHEVDSRVGSRPSGGDVVGKYECWSPSVVSAPAVGDVEGASAGEHGTKSGRETAKVLAARPGHLERHGVRPSGVDFDVARVQVPVEHFGHTIVEVGDVAVERHGHDCDNLRHCVLLSRDGDCVQGIARLLRKSFSGRRPQRSVGHSSEISKKSGLALSNSLNRLRHIFHACEITAFRYSLTMSRR